MDYKPKLVATTGSTYNCTVAKSLREEDGQERSEDAESWIVRRQAGGNHFKGAHWTADGTTIISESADNCVRTFIIPPDLLDERPVPLTLAPYSTIVSFESLHATTVSPNFNLQDPSTTFLLTSVSDHPIRLHSALAPDLLTSFPLINPQTEAVIAPHSLAFFPDGRSFVTGSQNLVCTFDLSRPGSGPSIRLPTIPSKRKKIVGGGVGMKGIISAITIEPSARLLAAGTFSRSIGLYGSNGHGDCIGVFNLQGSEADNAVGGKGVTQLLWSPCGRYLYVAERKSTGIMTYDIRKTGQLLGWLEGRRANTSQRLRVDIVPTNDMGSHELWAGGVDGSVTVWKDPHSQEGGHKPTRSWKAHDDSVTTATVHQTGSVLATCSGQRHFDESDLFESSFGLPPNDQLDNSLGLWAL